MLTSHIFTLPTHPAVVTSFPKFPNRELIPILCMSAIEVLLRLGFIVLVEFGFCNLVVCDVNGSVSVCEFR